MAMLLAEILDIAIDEADAFSLVWRDHLDYNEYAKKLEELLRPFLLSEKRASKWPGTELDEEAAIIRFYSLNRDSANLLKTNKYSYEFLSPFFPEDLAIYRGEKVFFSSCSHERLEWFQR